MNSANNAQLDIMTNDITQFSNTVPKTATVTLVLSESTSAQYSAGSITGTQTFSKTSTVSFYIKDPCVNTVINPTTITAWATLTNEIPGTKTFMESTDTI